MSRRQPSIRHRIKLLFLLFAVAVAILYGALLRYYLHQGLRTDAEFEMRVAAAEFSEIYEKDPQAKPPSWPHFWMSVGPEGLPERARRVFSPGQLPIDSFETHGGKMKEGKRQDFLVLMTHALPDGARLYTLREYPAEFFDIVDRPRRLFNAILPIGAGVVLLFAFASHLFLRKKEASHSLLLSWAENLGPEQLAEPIPRFRFKEEQHIAKLIHESMQRMQRTIEHEQRFLRNASHELRTPVTVIRTNASLLTRLIEDGSPARKPAERVTRAASGMARLIETLLWLNVDDSRVPAAEPVVMDEITKSLIEESRYLLAGKEVELTVELSPETLMLVPHAARIALGNLIRNAFQYAEDGQVCIRGKGDTIDIKNRATDPSPKATQEFGSGLGLELVEQICARSGWEYKHSFEGDGYHASIRFTEQTPAAASSDLGL